jgi:beta-glucosidase
VSLRLHGADEDLIAAVARANPRTVVAVVAGSAVVMSPWSGAVPAIVQSWYAGMEGGHGLADVLLGRCDAGGRLPFSVPETESQLPDFDAAAEDCTYDCWHGWWKLERDEQTAHFPFGFGLSFTSFAWGAFEAVPTPGGALVRGSVHNSGSRPGVEVVQVYGGREGDDPARSPRRLVGFARLEIAPGQDAAVEITVPFGRFARRDPAARRWTVLSGPYHLDVARHAGDGAARHLTV